MKTALLSVLLEITILSAQTVISEKKFDLVKFSGFWYEVGTSSNSDFFLKQKGIRRLGAAMVIPVENNIRVKTIYDKSHECVKEDIFGSQVDIPGKFAFPRSREAYVVDTDYTTYAIVNVSVLKRGMRLHVLKLLSRTLANTDKGLKRLREISESIGISRDHVFMLIYDDTCVKILKKVNPFVLLIFSETDTKRDMTCVAQDTGTIVIQLLGI